MASCRSTSRPSAVPRPGPVATRAVAGVVAIGVAVAVAASGELSAGALVAVLAAGLVVVGTGLARRTGSAAPVQRPPSTTLVLLGSAAAFEAVALASPAVPTLSDLADRPLAAPVVRAAAVVVWLALGAWLVARPTGALAAAMRRPVGRIAVLAGWLWVGVHFLAR
jgi:Family of unknown function (DUF6186)